MSEKIVRESGNFKNVEQVNHNGEMGFAIYENGSFTFRKQVGNAFPRTKVPWALAPMPIECKSEAELLAEIREAIFKYCDLSPEYNYDICAAWAMASWRLEAFNSVCYIEALGPPGSGKTRLLEALQALSYRGVLCSHVTFSSIFRAIEKDRVTLLLDQAEKLRSVKDSGDVISILDGGYRRGATKLLFDEKIDDYVAFEIFGFKAIAATNPLERSLEDRCIPILMQKAKREVPTWLKTDDKQLAQLRGKLLSYRFKLTAEESEDSEENEHRLMPLLEKVTRDSRLRELFYPLIYANKCSLSSESSLSSHPLAQAISTLDESRKEADYTSAYSEILHAIDSCIDLGLIVNGRILIQSITDAFNEVRDMKFRVSPATVGGYLKTLGFDKQHTREGNAIVYNEALMKQLHMRFVKVIETYAVKTGSPFPT